MRKLDGGEVAFEDNNKAVLEDIMQICISQIKRTIRKIRRTPSYLEKCIQKKILAIVLSVSVSVAGAL